MRTLLFLIILVPCLVLANATAQTSQLFEKLKSDPQALRIFLRMMPKGGELHYHWDGSSYPENMAYDIRHSKFCYNAKILGVDADNKFCPPSLQLNDFGSKPGLYQKLVNNWSLTTNYSNRIATENHFFQFFYGTEPIIQQYSASILSDELRRAANQNEDYMEMIYILDLPQMMDLGQQITFNKSFANMQKQLDETDVTSLVDNIVTQTNNYYNESRKEMKCNTKNAEPACKIKVRFITSAMRNMSPQVVFTQMYIAFLAANKDPLIVGVNLVGPENDYNSSRDYTLHMTMLRYLSKQFSKVKISLHAGELSLPEAPPNFMRNHIQQAITIAGAERIGHGVDIAYEDNALELLHKMAKQHICVEQLLTSNEKLLNVKGSEHPLPLYLKYHVPVVISTDDEGILRTDLTNEFWLAVTRYNLSYKQVKTMARNVLTYNFLPGKSLWENPDTFAPVKACYGQTLGSLRTSQACKAFLQSSEKARLQWKLEGELGQFEKTIVEKMKP